MADAGDGPDRADRVDYADRYPQWGSRTIATLMRIDGLPRAGLDRVSGAEAHGKSARGRLSGRTPPARRGAAGGVRRATVGANQVWQLDFSEFETRMGGTWRIGGTADYWSKFELG